MPCSSPLLRQPVHPPAPLQLTLLRPDLIQRLGLEEEAVAHDVAWLEDRAEVGERIAIEHDEIGELPCFDRSEIAIETNRLRAENRADAQHIVIRHAAGCDEEQVPRCAYALHFVVCADT